MGQGEPAMIPVRRLLGPLLVEAKRSHRSCQRVNIGVYYNEYWNYWGKSVVEELANHIASNLGNTRGFSAQNIWQMKQFYETYKDNEILSALLRELSLTNNLAEQIAGTC
jgi:hypothetical protein